MKKILLGVFAILLAAATVFTTQANMPAATSDDPVFHWFSGSSYVGEGTRAEMSQFCNELDEIECLGGYDPSVGVIRPNTAPESVLTKN